MLSKINTGVQLGLVGATMISAVLPYDVHIYLEFLWFVLFSLSPFATSSNLPLICDVRLIHRYFTATTTVASAVGYLFAKDTVKLLRERGIKSNSSREK